MHIGILPPSIAPIATPEFIRSVARAAEQLGFHSYWAPEHLVLFDEYESRYPYTADGKLAVSVGGPVDPLSLLTFAAAATTTIRLGTGICLVPQRNPVYTAKEVASLDWLSGGRFDFGIGVGWLREEFAVAGVPWERRGARAVEYVEVMKRLWSEGTAEHHGEFYDLPACRMDPKPIQRPHPPIIYGGETEVALKRAARAGDGWFGFDHDPADAARCVERLTTLLAARGRSREEFAVHISPYRRPLTRELAEQYEEASVDQVVCVIGGRDAEGTIGQLERLASAVLRS